MNKERKPLILSEMHEFDIKKVMDDIEYLDAIVDSCNDASVLEMWKARNGLQFLSDKERITLSQFVTANKRLEEIGKKFQQKCDCIKTIILD